MNMKIPTFYADPEGSLVIICPACGYTKTVDSKNVRIPKKPIKTKCTCGHIFSFQVELRQYHRKAVDLLGSCECARVRGHSRIRVRDLSMGGIGFILQSPMEIVEGDSLRIEFELDDARLTALVRSAVVKFVLGDTVGASFTGSWFDKDFAFYLKA
jgi:hypothetical protein